MASISIGSITVNAGRSVPEPTVYVQEDVGVRITGSHVVFFDPKTEDQLLNLARSDVDAIHSLMHSDPGMNMGGVGSLG